MNNKYGKTPQQRLEDALNQPSPTNDQIIAALPFSAAIDRLKMALQEEPGIFYAWQSNIASEFIFAYEKEFPLEPLSDNIIRASNTAAINFLNNLCNISTSTDSKKG